MSETLPESARQPTRFASIPVTITAMQWDGTLDGGRPIIDWAGADADIRWTNETPQRLIIRTLEGDMRANPGDWIIQGTEGEFYPCKDSVFQRKYRAEVDPNYQTPIYVMNLSEFPEDVAQRIISQFNGEY